MQEDLTNRGKFDCTDFDSFLMDAIDGTLDGEKLAMFRSHADSCKDCGPLFDHAKAGMNWLGLREEVEPPANLVDNILAVTSMKAPALKAAPAPAKSWVRRVSDWISPQLAPSVAGLMQPRFAMTAAMAFFSFTMLLNVAGVKVADLKRLDLRPSAISTAASMQYHQTTARV